MDRDPYSKSHATRARMTQRYAPQGFTGIGARRGTGCAVEVGDTRHDPNRERSMIVATARNASEAEKAHQRLTERGFIPTHPGSRDYTHPDGTEARVLRTLSSTLNPNQGHNR